MALLREFSSMLPSQRPRVSFQASIELSLTSRRCLVLFLLLSLSHCSLRTRDCRELLTLSSRHQRHSWRAPPLLLPLCLPDCLRAVRCSLCSLWETWFLPLALSWTSAVPRQMWHHCRQAQCHCSPLCPLECHQRRQQCHTAPQLRSLPTHSLPSVCCPRRLPMCHPLSPL